MARKSKDENIKPEDVRTPEELNKEERLRAAMRSSDPYESLAVEEPPKLVEIPTEKPVGEEGTNSNSETGGGNKPTISQAMESGSDLTDMQASLARLFPKSSTEQNRIQVGRIDPQIFLAGIHLASVNEIMRKDPMQDIDVCGIYLNKNYVDYSIGLDGDGRVDIALIAGAAREEKRIRNALGSLGSS